MNTVLVTTCNICWDEISDPQDVITCKWCHNDYCLPDIVNWQKKSKTCPICKHHFRLKPAEYYLSEFLSISKKGSNMTIDKLMAKITKVRSVNYHRWGNSSKYFRITIMLKSPIQLEKDLWYKRHRIEFKQLLYEVIAKDGGLTDVGISVKFNYRETNYWEIILGGSRHDVQLALGLLYYGFSLLL